VADVHHDLERQFGHGIDGVLANIEAQLTVEDQAGIAFGTGHSDTLAILEQLSGIAATHYRRDTQLTRDDRRVTGTPTTVGDDGASALHHGLPIGVGHVGYEYVAGLHAVHLGDVANDLHRAGADALADRAAFDQHGALFLQQVALHDIGAAAALHCFRTRLDDVQLAVVPVLGPLNIHRAAVVFLDDQRLAGQVADFFVGKTEACAVGLVDIDRLDRLARAGFGAVDHLDGLAAQVAPQDRRASGFEGVLV